MRSEQKEIEMSTITVVTAVSSNHYKSVCQFLKSCPKTVGTILVYDIGLSGEEIPHLQEQFPHIQYRRLDFSKLPAFAHLEAPCRGAYAWKPFIFNEVYDTLPAGHILVWCDAGNMITNIGQIVRAAQSHGLYSPFSCGMLKEYTHPETLRLLNVKEAHWGRTMRNAAVIAVVCGNTHIHEIVHEWKEKCLDASIIIPDGSSLKNHRFDQSVLSCLMYNHEIRSPGITVGTKTHCDCDYVPK